MPSLANIPEPTSAYRPPQETDAPAHVSPLATGLSLQGDGADAIDPNTGLADQPEHQIDSVSCLLLLMIAGGLLRLVFGLLGPVQGGLAEQRVGQLIGQGKAVIAGEAVSAYPLFELVSGTLMGAGLPGWVVVALGSVLTLGAIPAAYLLGRATTGRRIAGVIAAALLAVHPAVLTASNTLSGGALALGLVTIGLALLVSVPTRGLAAAVGGGVLLALAGLAAPLCWVIGLLAGPLTLRLSRSQPTGRAMGLSLAVVLIALTPVAGYRALIMGTAPHQLLPEFVPATPTSKALTPTGRLLVTMTDPSLAELGEALHLPMRDAGRLTVVRRPNDQAKARPDAVADTLADAWVLMNAALAGFAALSAGVMLARRRFVEVLALAAPLAALAWCILEPGEGLRLPMLALLGILAVGLFANRAPIDQAARASKARRKAAKQAAREEKEHARKEDVSAHELGKLYAFDRPTQGRRDRRRARRTKRTEPPKPEPKRKAVAQAPAEQGILTERVAQEASTPARPI